MKNQEELVQKIKDLIQSNRTAKALELLANEQLSSLDKELIILNGRFNKIKEEQIFGTIDDNDARKEMNRINVAILSLSEKIINKPGKSTIASNLIQVDKNNTKVRNYSLGFLGLILIGALAFWMTRASNPKPLDPSTNEAKASEQPASVDEGQIEQDRLDKIKRDQAAKRERKAKIKRDREEKRKRENSNRKIKVTLIKLVCEMSDDEGAGNDADMDRFKFILKANQSGCRENRDKGLTGNGMVIYDYSGGEITTPKGHVWMDTNQSVEITFDKEHCNKLILSIDGYARENDNSADEEARNSYSVPANNIYTTHSFKLSSSDFKYRCEFRIDKVGNW